jgi:hypothetical protein
MAIDKLLTTRHFVLTIRDQLYTNNIFDTNVATRKSNKSNKKA